MVVDPVSLLLMGTCLMACWPCLLPCCLVFPIIPYPLLIIKSTNPHPYKKVDTRYFCVYLEKNGFTLKKQNIEFDSNSAK